MSTDNPPARHIAAALARVAGPNATASQIADVAATTWLKIDATLAPIIGQRGVAALFKRSLHLNRPAYPCLAQAFESVQTTLDVTPLKAVLGHQTAGEAAAVGGATLQTFHELLAHLIGDSLTERLLRSVWATFLSGEAARDISR